MPHIVIQHDKKIKDEVNLPRLAQDLHDKLADQETISLEAIKTRTIQIENVIIADGSNNKMIHIEVQLLAGRSHDLKEHMALELFTTAQKSLENNDCALTVNISELGVYKK